MARCKGASPICTPSHPLSGGCKNSFCDQSFSGKFKMHEIGFSSECPFPAQKIFMGLSTREWETAPDVTVSCRCPRSPRSRLQRQPPTFPDRVCQARGPPSTPSPPTDHGLDAAHRHGRWSSTLTRQPCSETADPESACCSLKTRGQCPDELRILMDPLVRRRLECEGTQGKWQND